MTPLGLRTRRLTDRRIVSRGRDYVLCWIQQALRAEDNPVVDAAIALGNDRGLPVVVVHTLENRYPHASARLHRFILEASQSLGPGLRARGLRVERWVRPADPDAPSTVDVVARLAERAAAVVLGDVPTFVTHDYAKRLAAALPRAVLAVDACTLVPMNAFPERLGSTKAFRAAHTPLRAEHLAVDTTRAPEHGPFEGDLDLSGGLDLAGFENLDADGLDALIAQTGVDPSLPPAPDFRGHREAALARLRHAVRTVVPRYKWTRNNPALPDSTSQLSPWMHFGVVSPREVVLEVDAAIERGDVPRAARWKFLDETLTWREVNLHRARFVPDAAAYETVPGWARRTLAEHAGDPRPAIYPLDALVHGETDDEVWNAAQKQFLYEGWMHNNLRMYWVKQILKWRPTPEDAWATAVYLNDRLSLDGRDAATYGGIRWGFGESKRASSEAAVYGWVPRKTSGALRRRDGVPAWLAEQAARAPYRISVPEG